jgi:Tol biopolymer transport system component
MIRNLGLRSASVLLACVALTTTAGAASASGAAVQVPAWKIVYIRNDGGLGVWTSSQRRTFRLRGVPTDPGGVSNWPAAWSPDGRYIAFSRALGRPGIYVVRVGHGRPQRLFKTYQDAYGVGLAWSPDGRKLAFSIDCDYEPGPTAEEKCRSGRNGITALYTIQRDGSHLQRLVAVPSTFAPVPKIWGDTWSPDGRHIAYILTCVNGCSDFLDTIDAAGGSPQLVAKVGPNYVLGAPSWSPNGRWIAYGDHCYGPQIGGDIRCDLVVRESSGGHPRVLLHSFERFDTGLWPAAWTPDSRTLLHSQYREHGRPALVTINVETGRQRIVLTTFADVIATSRDGRTFAFIPDAALPTPSVATLSGRILDRGPRIPFFSGLEATEGGGGSASLWIH